MGVNHFEQFAKCSKVMKLSSQQCFDTIRFCLGACGQGQWLSEREVAVSVDVAAVIAAV